MAFSAGTTRSATYRVLATDYNLSINNVNYLGSGTPGTGRAAVMATSVLTTSLPASAASWTNMLFASEEYDTSGMHDTTTNTGRLTVPAGEGGLYLIQATANLAQSSNAGGIVLQVRKNGAASTAPTLQASSSLFTSLTANVIPSCSVNGMIRLAAADYLELYVIQNSSAAVLLAGTTQAHRFGAIWMSA